MKRSKERRAFILREIDRCGFVKFDRLKQEFADSEDSALSNSSILADVDYLRDFGFGLVSHDATIFRENEHISATLRHRKSLRREEKMQIARMVASLIFGSEKMRLDDETQMKMYYPREKLLEILNQHPSLVEKFQSVWNESARVLSVDSGTTNEVVCQMLGRASLPCSTLNRLRIYSNCISHFEVLSSLKYPFELFVLGGQIKNQSDAIIGEDASSCVDAWGVKFDVAVVGATNVIVGERNSLMCFGPDEAMIKGKILYNSKIKIITADSSKITINGDLGANAFASFDSVDCLVTDSQILSEEKSHILEQLLSAGLVVIPALADSD